MTPERIEDIGEQLRAKITSKFTASTFLAGFARTVITGQVFTLWQVDKELSPFYPISVGAVAGALHLFVQAIIRLDELTMPKLFWEDRLELRAQPPSDDGRLEYHNLWDLRDRMVFFWYRLTIAATIVTALAVLVMLVPHRLVHAPGFSIHTLRIATPLTVLVCWAVAACYTRTVTSKAEKKFGQLRHD